MNLLKRMFGLEKVEILPPTMTVEEAYQVLRLPFNSDWQTVMRKGRMPYPRYMISRGPRRHWAHNSSEQIERIKIALTVVEEYLGQS